MFTDSFCTISTHSYPLKAYKKDLCPIFFNINVRVLWLNGSSSTINIALESLFGVVTTSNIAYDSYKSLIPLIVGLLIGYFSKGLMSWI